MPPAAWYRKGRPTAGGTVPTASSSPGGSLLRLSPGGNSGSGPTVLLHSLEDVDTMGVESVHVVTEVEP